jgi:hypothetical protein
MPDAPDRAKGTDTVSYDRILASDDTELDDWSIRGLEKMRDFLAIELNEPELTKSKVADWARTGKIDTDRFGPRERISTAKRLRASIGLRPPVTA